MKFVSTFHTKEVVGRMCCNHAPQVRMPCFANLLVINVFMVKDINPSCQAITIYVPCSCDTCLLC